MSENAAAPPRAGRRTDEAKAAMQRRIRGLLLSSDLRGLRSDLARAVELVQYYQCSYRDVSEATGIGVSKIQRAKKAVDDHRPLSRPGRLPAMDDIANDQLKEWVQRQTAANIFPTAAEVGTKVRHLANVSQPAHTGT